jgi:hypothetical protein
MRMLWWTAALVMLSACRGPEPPPYKPIADTKLLMESVLDPAADVIWESAGSIITASGTEELSPKSEEEWLAVRNSAVALAESGNLLMMAPRARDAQWTEISQSLVDTAAQAIQAAEAKNVDQIFTIGGDIYLVCTNCHSKYMDSIANAP